MLTWCLAIRAQQLRNRDSLAGLGWRSMAQGGRFLPGAGQCQRGRWNRLPETLNECFCGAHLFPIGDEECHVEGYFGSRKRELFSLGTIMNLPQVFPARSPRRGVGGIHVPDSMEALDNAGRMLAIDHSQLLMSKKRAGVSMHSSDTSGQGDWMGCSFRLTHVLRPRQSRALLGPWREPDARLLNADGCQAKMSCDAACVFARAVEAGYRAVHGSDRGFGSSVVRPRRWRNRWACL